jgi:SNF2 family DNA or RNA helicase
MNTLSIGFDRIKLKLEHGPDQLALRQMTGKVEEVALGEFEIALSTQNLSRLFTSFPGITVVGSRRHLDTLKERLAHYKEAKREMGKVLKEEHWPVPPNGKFVPYRHQGWIVGGLIANPYANIFVAPGAGKSGATGRAVELLLEERRVSRGKVLVSAPLSILNASWEDDLRQFTNLRTAILWCADSNKTLLGAEKILLHDFGPKPSGVVSTKTKTGVYYQHPETKQVLRKLTILDGGGFIKYEAQWKEGTTLDGTKIQFGPVYGRTHQTEKTRENYIRDQLARIDVDVFLINHDGVRIYQDILKEHEFEWVVVDESTKIKNPRSGVYQAHVAMSWKARRRNILTGTPNPNGYIDLWSQFYFLDRGLTLEPCLKDFLKEYFRAVPVGRFGPPGERKDAIKYELRDEKSKQALIARVRATGVCLEQRECVDLPPRTDARRLVRMSPEQERAYDEMSLSLVAELIDAPTGRRQRADAVNVLSKIMKLRQITSGFLIGRDGESVALTHNPKLLDLDDLLDDLGTEKCVIVAQFRQEIENLMRRYAHRNARCIHGDISPKDRTDIIRDFQTTSFCQDLILQPQAAAHGITLTRSNQLIYISLDWNFEYYYQVGKRIERIGQKNPITVWHSLAQYLDGSHTIDEDLLDILEGKSKDRSSLFNGPSEQTNKELAERLTQHLVEQVRNRHGNNAK